MKPRSLVIGILAPLQIPRTATHDQSCDYFSHFFPSSFIHSPSGELLKTRIYEWLRGRYVEIIVSRRWLTHLTQTQVWLVSWKNCSKDPGRSTFHQVCTSYSMPMFINTLVSHLLTLGQAEDTPGSIAVAGFPWEKILAGASHSSPELNTG